MKIISKLSLIFTFFILLQSCSSDDNSSNASDDFIGKWVRIDSNSNLENELNFNEDYSGIKIYLERNGEQATSSAIDFNWNATDSELTITFAEEEIISPYSFDTNGYLIITELSEIPYVKEEEN